MRLFFILSVIFIFSYSGFCGPKGLILYDLRCENLKNPMGIDNTTPRFSWKISSNKNGTVQKAFQLMVASDPSWLDKDQPDLWNSEKVESASSVLTLYQGKKLESGLAACWKVRVWDNSGNVSSWSPVCNFSIGLLNKSAWQASYIGFPSEAGFKNSPQLTKTFDLDKTGHHMFLYVNSLGYHEVYLNGLKVGEGVLSPAVSQFDKRSRVITYDVSSLVRKGRNDLVLWLASGWYRSGFPGVLEKGPGALVKAQLEQVSDNRRKVILSTDSSWKGRSSGYTRIDRWTSDHYGGEEIDANQILANLSGESLDNASWQSVAEVSVPDHEVSPQMAEVNRIRETVHPTEVIRLSEKEFLVDMGKTLTGWIEIHFPKLEKSQMITMEYCDHLDENDQFVDQGQTDRYIASGEEAEIFKNKFNYHGFRYIKIKNLAKIPDKKSIQAYLVHTCYELASGFQCSDPELNQIHDMIFYTLRCLSLGGYLVDCPQLERLGYGGDGNASTMTAQTMFNLNPLYANWLQAWADCIRPDGDLPYTAPNPFSAGGGPYWCGFIITASWNTYMNYGDFSVLQKYYPVMQKWLEFVDKHSFVGLLKRWPDNDYRGWYLGDWASPRGVDQTTEASIDLVNNCFIVVCLDRMEKIAGVMGKPIDAQGYLQKKNQLQQLIHQRFFDPSKNSYATGTQIDLTYPMLAGVVPEDLKDAVTKSLINEIENNRGGHFSCGLVGIPVFTEWAVKNNAAELMFSLLKKRGYPGYLDMIDHGATTTWEHWDGLRSRIHNCYNGVGSWFYQALGGIRPVEDVPAYQKVLIQLQIPSGVNWAKIFKETPYGKLVVNWKLAGKKLNLDLEIPVGMEVEVPIHSVAGKYTFNGKDFIMEAGKSSSIYLKSGKHRISYDRD